MEEWSSPEVSCQRTPRVLSWRKCCGFFDGPIYRIKYQESRPLTTNTFLAYTCGLIEYGYPHLSKDACNRDTPPFVPDDPEVSSNMDTPI
jgi:hypothetical protein